MPPIPFLAQQIQAKYAIEKPFDGLAAAHLSKEGLVIRSNGLADLLVQPQRICLEGWQAEARHEFPAPRQRVHRLDAPQHAPPVLP